MFDCHTHLCEKEGLAADIIALPRNPLEDILVLKEVAFVMKDGRVVKHDGYIGRRSQSYNFRNII